MKKIIIILITTIIFSCSKTNDKKISDDDWEIYSKTCNTINNKIENELFLVANDICFIGDKELETEDNVVIKIKHSEKILKNKELYQKQKMMLKKFNEIFFQFCFCFFNEKECIFSNEKSLSALAVYFFFLLSNFFKEPFKFF